MVISHSGLVHALLGIDEYDALLAHPVNGTSWEGFAIESILAVVPNASQNWFYRSATGDEIDLLLKLPGRAKPWAIEVKNGLAPKLEAGYYRACEITKPERQFAVYAGKERFWLTKQAEAISLPELCNEISIA